MSARGLIAGCLLATLAGCATTHQPQEARIEPAALDKLAALPVVDGTGAGAALDELAIQREAVCHAAAQSAVSTHLAARRGVPWPELEAIIRKRMSAHPGAMEFGLASALVAYHSTESLPVIYGGTVVACRDVPMSTWMQ